MTRYLFLLILSLLTSNAWGYDLETTDENGVSLYFDIVSADNVTIVGCSKVEIGTDIVIPSYLNFEGKTFSVTAIGKDAFRYSNLKSIVIPSSVETIGVEAFVSCSYIENVELNEGLTKIEKQAFSSCHNLTNIKIPDTVKSIEDGAFRDCNRLIVFTLGKGIKDIGVRILEKCTDLCFIEIKTEKVPKSDNLKYPDLSGIQPNTCSIYVPETLIAKYKSWNPIYNYKSDSELQKDIKQRTNEPFYAWANLGPYVVTPISGTDNASIVVAPGLMLGSENSKRDMDIPSEITFLGRKFTVTTIDEDAFKGQKYIQRIRIPSTVKTINDNAFREMENLVDVYFSEGLETIGKSAFRGCKNLKWIELPSSVKRIESYAFKDCRASHNIVFIGESIEEMGDLVFNNSYIDFIYIAKKTQPRITENTFSGINGGCSLNVPSKCKDAYQDWAKYFKEVNDSYINYEEMPLTPLYELRPPFPYEYDGVTLMYYLLDDTKVSVVPDKSYRKIEGKVIVPPTVTYQGKRYSVSSINLYAFEYCWYITEVYLPETLEAIYISAFQNCSRLEKILLPESLKIISGFVFSNCIKLKEIHIPNKVETIPVGGFSKCDALEKITIGSSVEVIEDYAFALCPNIKEVSVFRSTPPALGEKVFNPGLFGVRLNIPIGSMSAYFKFHTEWGKYFSSSYVTEIE